MVAALNAADKDYVASNAAGVITLTYNDGEDHALVEASTIGTVTAAATTVTDGGKATWVVNTANQTAGNAALAIDDLISDTNGTVNAYKAQLTVTYKDLTSTVTVASTDYTTSDLQINQAIKDAINNDDTLNKLIVAEDGPANTLVITSLIDGQQTVTDLAFAMTTTGVTYNAIELAAMNTAWGTTYATEALAITAMNGVLTPLTAANASYDAQFAESDLGTLAGTESTNVNDSTISLGLGSDVVVLSTDTTGGTTLESENVVELNEFDSNTTNVNTIVNFEVGAAGAGVDQIDFVGDYAGTFANEFGASTITATGLDDGDISLYDFDAFTAIATVTYDNMTTTNLLAMLNADVNADATGLATETDTTLILIAESGTADDNLFKAYQVTSVGNSADFNSAQLIGQINLADTDISALTADNIA